jgi:hypothetical protein
MDKLYSTSKAGVAPTFSGSKPLQYQTLVQGFQKVANALEEGELELTDYVFNPAVVSAIHSSDKVPALQSTLSWVVKQNSALKNICYAVQHFHELPVADAYKELRMYDFQRLCTSYLLTLKSGKGRLLSGPVQTLDGMKVASICQGSLCGNHATPPELVDAVAALSPTFLKVSLKQPEKKK